MFGQLTPWEDCSNNCEFCSQRETKVHLTLAEKKKRLMKASAWMNRESNKYDRFGLIGGELFDTEGLDKEWRCVADSMSQMSAKVIFLATHLICNIDGMLDFISYIPKSKEVVICTSYDAKGRFHSSEALELWKSNIERVHNAGYKICCTCILTQELVTSDELPIPDYVYVSLIEPIPRWSYWYLYYDPARDGEPRSHFMNDMKDFPITLPMRKDTLRWLSKHKKIAEHYADYFGTHSDDLYEFVDGEYRLTSDDRFAKPQCDCGHQYSARCYADSPKCIQCDVKEMFEW